MKKVVRLTEQDLHRIVKESVKRMLMTELDWKTYANAAKKRLQQYRANPTQKSKWEKYQQLSKAANQKFDDDFIGNMKNDTLGDKLRGKSSPKFNGHIDLAMTDRMPYGAIKGSNKSGDTLFSTKKGAYHSSTGRTAPNTFFKNKEVADKFIKANDELWDYDDGNYEYVNGEGWK